MSIMIDQYMKLISEEKPKGFLGLFSKIKFSIKRKSFINKIKNMNKFSNIDLMNFGWIINNGITTFGDDILPRDVNVVCHSNLLNPTSFYNYNGLSISFIVEANKNNIDLNIQNKDNNIGIIKSVESIPDINTKNSDLIFDILREIIVSTIKTILDKSERIDN